jgi:putative heme transporter
VLPQFAGFRNGVTVLANLNVALVALAIASQIASLVCYAQLTRSLLSPPERPRLATVMRLQLVTLAASHVLPGGSFTSTPIGFRLLQNAGVGSANASFVLAVQSIGSAVVLNVILWIALVISIPLHGANAAYAGAALLGVFLLLGFIALLFGVSRGSSFVDRVEEIARRVQFVNVKALSSFLRGLVVSGGQLSKDLPRLRRAAWLAAGQWIADAGSLWLFLAAAGRILEPDGLLVAFGMANVVASIPLTPGGVGVYEAVLTSSLIGFGVPRTPALVAVLCYRLIAFWLPIPIGAIMYLLAGGKKDNKHDYDIEDRKAFRSKSDSDPSHETMHTGEPQHHAHSDREGIV